MTELSPRGTTHSHTAVRTRKLAREPSMTDHLKSAPVAYQNETFINSPDGRILRVLAEYQEPLARFRPEQIQDTVVFFGSARFQGRQDAAKHLETIEHSHTAGDAARVQ